MRPVVLGRGWRGATAFFALGVAISFEASAQTTPASPPTREQVEQPRPEQPDREQRVRVESRGAIEAAPCPLRSYDLKVEINRLAFSGYNGGPLADEIRSLLADVAPPAAGAREIAVVCDIRDEATERLRRAGYVASVQIPPQTIDNGELRLEVITARIVELRVQGDAPPYRGTLAARAEQLKALDPLNERDAERILLVAGDIPGLDVQLSLRPAGTVPGEVIGDLSVVYRPWSVTANVNNFGSRQLGRESAYVRAEAYGLLGMQDVTYVGGSTTFDFEEQRVAQIGQLLGIGQHGTTLEASLLYAWSRPDVGALDLRSESLVGTLALSTPLFRSRRRSIDLTGGFEVIEQRTRVHGGGTSVPLNRDKLRVAFLRGDAELRGFTGFGAPLYSLAASLELRKGLDIFDASERFEVSPGGYTPSRFSGDPTAFVARADIDGVINVSPAFSIAGRARGQYSEQPLLNFEEFSVGNLTIGRGYDPGANSADRAIGLRAEPRLTVFNDGVNQVDLFGFYDSVWIWNLDPNAVETGRRLSSWGGGVRGVVRGLGLVEAIYAHPEDRALLVPGARRESDKLLLSLTIQYPAGGR